MKMKVLIVLGAIFLCLGIGLILPRFMNDGTNGKEVDVEQLRIQFEQELEALILKELQEQAEIEAAEKDLYEQFSKEYDEMMVLELADVESDEVTVEAEEIPVEETGVEPVESDEPDEMVESTTDLDPDISEETDVRPTSEEDTSPVEETTISEEVATEETPDDPVDEVVPEPEEDTDTASDLSAALDNLSYTPEQQASKDAWVQDQVNANREEIADEDIYAGAEIYSILDTNYLFGLAEGGLTDEEKLEVEAYLTETLSPDQIDVVMGLYYKYIHLLN